MSERSLYFASIVYLESAPENWIQILEETHIPSLISPLHDRDLNENGEPKKEHYHILCMFESLKSQQQYSNIVSKINAVGSEMVLAPKSYALYLAHENAPEKAQYDPKDIIALSGGKEFLDNLRISSTNRQDIITDIIRFCQNENIDCYADIVEYSLDNNKEWFQVLVEGSASIMLTNYLKSRTWRNSKNYK